jgi:hypothetical protein
VGLDVNGFTIRAPGDLVLGDAAQMRLDSSNRVRQLGSTVLGAQASGLGGAAVIYPWVANQVDSAAGASWTGTVFTAAVAGVYHASLSIILDLGGPDGGNTFNPVRAGYAGVAVNGVLTSYTYAANSNAWDTMTFSECYKLVTGDTITFFVNIAPYPASNSLGAYRSNHNSMTVALIG